MDVSEQIQAFFIAAVSTILLISNLPTLKDRFVTYGPRAINHDRSGVRTADVRTGIVPNTLDALATLQVPHAWFLHFYIVSVASSIFWLVQLTTKGSAFQAAARYGQPKHPANSMTINQVALTWTMMTVQGTRRLLESILFAKSSASRMWFAHWLLGIAFYIAVGVAVWIDGTVALLTTDSISSNVTISAPSLKTMIAIPIFILASGAQHDCHAYLASLPKYKLPMHPIFHFLICPHYFLECLIYLSMAILAAPVDAVLNKTILAALVFVITNLGVTAATTKQWYEKKFGKESVAQRWKMVPWVF